MGITRFVLAAAVGVLITHSSASAGEIRVLSTIAVKTVMEDLIPRFERESGHRVAIQYGTTAVLKKQIEAGETFDVAILVSGPMNETAKQGFFRDGERPAVSKVGRSY